ncbi:MAG: glycosyltransferase family 2 protein [Prevotella sp.]|nr:glycosyltransferase family 2 protein [Prevotella sp.]
MNYEVTIAIPVYNAEKYLHETLMSALTQDYPSIEFLILDDCGTDGSIDMVRQLQHEHPRGGDIHIVSQEFNKGIGAARNRVLKEAKGRYLYFLDADDLILPNTISLMMAQVKEHDAEVVMASYEQIKAFVAEPEKVLFRLPRKVFTEPHSLATYAFHNYGALNANVWNVLMDLDLIRKNDLQFVNTNYWEDMVFKHELVTYVTRAVLMPEITYSYICRKDTLSKFQDRDVIPKDEILCNVATVDTLKYSCKRLRGKPYFSHWLKCVLKTDFYIILYVLERQHRIIPKVTDLELRNFLHSPLSVWSTLRYTGLSCWGYKLLSILPPRLSVGLIKMMGKARH